MKKEAFVVIVVVPAEAAFPPVLELFPAIVALAFCIRIYLCPSPVVWYVLEKSEGTVIVALEPEHVIPFFVLLGLYLSQLVLSIKGTPFK